MQVKREIDVNGSTTDLSILLRATGIYAKNLAAISGGRQRHLARLGYIVMTQYEMQASHLFCIAYSVADNLPFSLNNDTPDKHSNVLNLPSPSDRVIRYEVPPGDSFPGLMGAQSYDTTEMTLRRFTASPGTTLTMQYDYGDGWEIALQLEDVPWDEALSGKLLRRL